jgi:hypothetical protein
MIFFGGNFWQENFLGEIFWEDFFGRIFLGEFFWEKFFWGNFLGGIFWEKFFGRNFLGGILCLHCYLNMKRIDLFVKILSQWRRKEGQEFRSLEVRRQAHRT